MSLEEHDWYWGAVDREVVCEELEDRYDGTFIVRDGTTPPDKTLHVVYRGVTKHLKILVKSEGVGLSPDKLIFKSVVHLINHFR